MKGLFIILLSYLFSFGVNSQEIVLGVENLDYSPFYSSKGRHYQGYTRDLFDEFSKETGVQIVFSTKKVNKLYEEFFNGNVGAKFPDNPNWNKGKRSGKSIEYSSVIISTKVGLVVKKDKASAAKTTIKKVGVVEGFTPWVLLEDIKSGVISLEEQGSTRKLIKMLYDGKIDAIYTSEDVIKVYDKKKGLVMSSAYPTTKDEFHVSSLNNKEFIKKFDTWFKSNLEKVKKIKSSHGL